MKRFWSVLLAFLLGCVLIAPTSAAAAAGDPFGNFERAAAVDGGIEVKGWAIDPDTTAPIYVWVTLDGAGRHLYANRSRPDVAAAHPDAGPNHGFATTLAAEPGAHRVCVTASNVGPGSHKSLACRDVTLPDDSPFGNFERASAVDGGIEVKGWAIDPDTTAPIYVWVTVDGAGVHLSANRARPDVATRYPASGPNHGFLGTVNASPGMHRVCVTAANVGPGAHRSLACRDVTLSAVDVYSPVPAPEPSPVWAPEIGSTWQWQLNSGDVDTSVEAEIYDVDGFEVDAATVASLQAQGRRVICYIDAGGWENYRPDASDYPESVLGMTIGGWPDERWVDVREIELLRPIIANRFDMCAEKGFDAVEPDVLDAYENKSGFNITKADQIAFNEMVFDLAHERGLGVAMKNGAGIAPEMVVAADFAIVEECYAYSECDDYTVFVAAGKAVLHVEYDEAIEKLCPVTQPLGFSSMRKNLDLDAWRQPCAEFGLST